MDDAERTLKLELRQAPGPAAKRPVLVVLQGASLGLAHPIEGPRIVVGRGAGSDLTLRDALASRQHAEILQLASAGGVIEHYVGDLGSTNGTFVNGARIRGRQLLQDGDKLEIGSHRIKFALLDEFEAEFQERLHQMTQRDELTGLRSRRSLFAELEGEIAAASRSAEREPISVWMLDLDHFKRINDGRGHLVGSRTIREVGHILRDVLGSVDRAARYGGEEYLAWGRCDEAAGFELAERIRSGVAERQFGAESGDAREALRVTISIGLACFPEGGETALELVQHADLALFRAKHSGRNRTSVYDPALDTADAGRPAVDASALLGPADAQ